MTTVPNKPKTPHRTVRIDNELWSDSQVIAAALGETVTDAVRRGLLEYRDTHRDLLPD